MIAETVFDTVRSSSITSATAVIRRLHDEGGRIRSFRSYGSGIPAPGQPQNPLRYAVTWNPRNVVMSGHGGAQYLEHGRIRIVPFHHVFHRTWHVDVKGIGSLEAPRGTLTHHYVTDERGILKSVNLIVGTTNNHAAICMSIKKAAQGLIKKGVEITEGLLNKVEMAFRAYDPCFACATHNLPGGMPMTVRLRAADGTVLSERSRF